VITPGYFRALGITLVRGRAFDESDRADRPPVVIVNQAFVDRFLPGRDPLGQILTYGGDHRHEIVGVVANARYRDVEQPADPTFYVPLDQNEERWPFLSFTVWFDDGSGARAAGAGTSPGTIASAIRTAVHAADPNQPVARIRTYDELLATSLASRRFNTLLVGVFALTALLLAALGTYGVMAYGVASRTRELGVRAALGASPADLRRMVLRQGAWLSGVAVVMGLGVAWLATQSMAALLFEVRPGDPWTFAAVAVVLSSVALLATWLPARAATRVDPIRALREQ
jgi:predicted permease